MNDLKDFDNIKVKVGLMIIYGLNCNDILRGFEGPWFKNLRTIIYRPRSMFVIFCQFHKLNFWCRKRNSRMSRGVIMGLRAIATHILRPVSHEP